jgi:hypothetical protein
MAIAVDATVRGRDALVPELAARDAALDDAADRSLAADLAGPPVVLPSQTRLGRETFSVVSREVADHLVHRIAQGPAAHARGARRHDDAAAGVACDRYRHKSLPALSCQASPVRSSHSGSRTAIREFSADHSHHARTTRGRP